MTEQMEDVLALSLINKGGKFANSFGLCKVLSLFFQLIHCSVIVKRISSQKYIETNSIDGIEYFTISSIGKIMLEQEGEKSIEQIKKIFPERSDTLDSLKP